MAYAGDFSIRGGNDPGFGRSVAWDSDLSAGYSSTVLRSDLSEAPVGWGSLDDRAVAALLDRLQPRAILLNSLNYRFDIVAYVMARLRGIPVWIRCETQDQAFERSKFISILRSFCYRLLYLGLERPFPIGGGANRQSALAGSRPQSKVIMQAFSVLHR